MSQNIKPITDTATPVSHSHGITARIIQQHLYLVTLLKCRFMNTGIYRKLCLSSLYWCYILSFTSNLRHSSQSSTLSVRLYSFQEMRRSDIFICLWMKDVSSFSVRLLSDVYAYLWFNLSVRFSSKNTVEISYLLFLKFRYDLCYISAGIRDIQVDNLGSPSGLQ